METNIFSGERAELFLCLIENKSPSPSTDLCDPQTRVASYWITAANSWFTCRERRNSVRMSCGQQLKFNTKNSTTAKQVQQHFIQSESSIDSSNKYESFWNFYWRTEQNEWMNEVI